MLSSLVLMSAILASILVEDQAVPVQGNYYDPHGNDISSNSGQLKDNCCIIPSCDDSGHCYEILSCGYVCSKGGYRPANSYGFTSGYRLKGFYMKNDCHFGECKTYRFLCDHCPDPKDNYFSIYTVRKDCKSCYY